MIGKNPIDVEGNLLVLRVQGLDRMWTLLRDIRVPLSSIEEVFVNKSPHTVELGTRGPGLDAFGRLVGTFRVKGVRNFWSFIGTGPVLEIRFAEEERFRHFYLSVDDPAERKRALDLAVSNL